MPRSFRDTLDYDAANVFLNTNEFAQSLTLTHATGGTAAMTANQRLSLAGLLPIPDAAISVYDRLQLLGLYRIGEAALNDADTETISGIVELDFEDEGQGTNLDDQFGRRTQRMGRVHVAASAAVVVDDKPEVCDALTIDGERWSCIRVEGRDRSMKTIVIRRDEKITTKQGRTRQ